MYKYTKKIYQHYKIYDSVGFPIGEIYNKNFKIHINFSISISHDSLIKFLNQLNDLREKFEIDVGYGDYVLNTK